MAISGIDLTVGAGELFVIVGASGVGKTTLLKTIAGLVAHEGRILAGNEPLHSLPPHGRRIGYVPQDLCLFPHMSALDNVLIGMARSDLDAGGRRARACELLEMLGLDGLAGRRPDQLSGGERQRVALARALASAPRLLLLDEPFSSLDQPTRSRLRGELKRLQRDLALTTLFVTHDLAEAEQLGDRIGTMRGGTLTERGDGPDLTLSPEEIRIGSLRPGGGHHLRARVLSVIHGDQTTTLTLSVQGQALAADGLIFPLIEPGAEIDIEISP